MRALRLQHIRLVVAAIILSGCVGCDQLTKSIATHSLRDNSPQSYLNGAVRIEYVLNPGGFLSLGSDLPEEFRRWIFIGAGGIGNLIDRMSNNGFVTDFINVGIGPLRTGIFNVVDVAVTFGAIAAVLLIQRR